MNDIKVNFDLTLSSDETEGTLTLNENTITSFDGKSTVTCDIEKIEEAVQFTDIGCGRLELRLKGAPEDGSENILLCRFTMSCVYEIGELVKILNHLILTGELLPLNTTGLPVCPKCHRHYIKGMSICVYCAKKTYVFGRAFGYFKPYLKTVAASALFLTLANVMNALLPLFNSALLDNYLVPADGATPYFTSRTTGIIVTALLMALVFLISKVFSVISTRMSNKVGSGFSSDLRLIVYNKLQTLSLSFVSGKSTGNLIHRITKDTERVKDFFNEQGRYLIEQAIMFTVILAILVSTSVKLTLLVLLPVPFALFLMSRFRRSTRMRYSRQWRADSKATSVLHDIIKGIRVVKSFGNEKREIEKFSNASKKLADISASNEKYWALTYPLVGNIMAFGEIFVLLFGGKMVLDGELTLGELTRFNLYLAYLYAPLDWLSTFPRRLADASTALLKIYEIIDEPVKIDDSKEPQSLDATGDIEFKNVFFGYKSYEPVLKNVNLKIESGKMLGLVGHSGAGKSTLINLCMRLYDPTAGAITIGGTDLKDVKQSELRSRIGVVFQETYLFSGSVYDNIAYSKPSASYEEVIAAAIAANAHEFIIKLPDGYNTVIGENGHTLSGGERQRLSIARAVLKDPDILILDEATASLDPETELKIQEALSRLTKGRTTIAIAHRLSTLRNADSLAVIEKGTVAETGTHEQLVEKGGIYASLVSAQRQTARLH